MSQNYYVYELCDPRTKKPFYVGKGMGLRYKEYLKEDAAINSHTKAVIEDIKLSGKELEINIVQKNLTEDEALKLEASLIKKYGRVTKDPGGLLTNIKSHGNKGRLGNKLEQYATLQIKTEVKDQVVDFCNRKGFKIGRFVENLFLQAVSGSGGSFSGSLGR
jgi:hypothetical protein